MVVTIEPGFYQVPGILAPARASGEYDDAVNWDQLDQFFSRARAFALKDDVHITESGCQVLYPGASQHPRRR